MTEPVERLFKIWTDGGARGNPGPAGIGVRILEIDSNNQEQPVAELSQYLGTATNNQAEYQALIEGLRWLVDSLETVGQSINMVKLELYTDSELMAYQIQGRYRVKNAELRPLYDQVIGQLQVFKSYVIEPIRREKNQVADKLVNQAIDQALSQTKISR